jgi:protein phosphatase
MTKDHTIPGILLQKNRLTEEEARKHPMKYMLLQCVGCKSCKPESGHFSVKPGDIVFLCSDGLHDEISSETMISILKMEKSWEQKFEKLLDSALEHGEIPPEAVISLLQAKQTLQQKFESLLEAAIEAGGSDNITIVGTEI